jgi:GNAT superfamily N-acetyltransferase
VTVSSELRRLTRGDVAGGFALSSEAGWNQSEADWRFLRGAGVGVGIDDGGRLVATAIVLPLGERIGWIAMVLVALSHRKRGFATRMMDWAVEHCRRGGLVAALDATPAGREVYRRLGFGDGPRILRLAAPSDFGCAEPATDRFEIAEILDLDGCAFGTDRAAVLRELAVRTPALALACRRAGRIVGYALGRVGRIAHEIGPIVAEDDATAITLLRAAGAKAGGAAVIADAFEARRGFVDALLAAGWIEQRPYTRMSIGALPVGAPETVFAIAGPEYA